MTGCYCYEVRMSRNFYNKKHLPHAYSLRN